VGKTKAVVCKRQSQHKDTWGGEQMRRREKNQMRHTKDQRKKDKLEKKKEKSKVRKNSREQSWIRDF